MAVAEIKDVPKREHLIDYVSAGFTLDQFLFCEKPLAFIMGPVGSGKTSASILKIWNHATAIPCDHKGYRRSRVLIIRKQYSELENATIPSWRKCFPEFDDDGSPIYGPILGQKGGGYIHKIKTLLPDNTVVDLTAYFVAIGDASAEEKLRGYEVTFAWLNEFKELDMEVVRQAHSRTGRFPDYMAPSLRTRFSFGDSNAVSTYHWFYRRKEMMAQEEFSDAELLLLNKMELFVQPPAVFRRTVNEKTIWQVNPEAENIHNLIDGYYEDQLAFGMDTESQNWVSINLANEYSLDIKGKPVIPEYKDEIHTTQTRDIAPGIPVHIGIDYGRTPCALFVQEFPSGRLRAIREVITDPNLEKMGIVQFKDPLKRMIQEFKDLKCPIKTITGDPAGENPDQVVDNAPAEILRVAKIHVSPAFTNGFDIRREAQAKPFTQLIDGKPMMEVSVACPIFREALRGGYHYKKVAGDGERYADRPNKNHPHSDIADAGQYTVLGIGLGEELVYGEDEDFDQPLKLTEDPFV